MGATYNDRLPSDASITGATVVVPVDKQAIFRFKAGGTTTILGANATYTGSTLDALQFKRFTGAVSASHAGTLALEQSDDGITWYRLTSTAITAGTPAKFTEDIVLRYIRMVYINGATAQTSFFLSGYLSAE